MRQFIKTRLRRAAVALPVSAALVVVLLPVSGCSRRPAPAPVQAPAAAAPAPRIPTGSEVFASATASLTTSLESARRALSRGSTDATAIAAVRDFAATLPELDKGVQADFAKTRDILAKVGSKEKDAIESRVERTYAKRRDALAKRLAAVASAESTAALRTAIASTADYLSSITPEEPYQPLGASLPHRIVDAHAGPPVLGAKIAPAYAPNTPGATPSTLPVTPAAADTTQTVEIQFSPEITALVASLGADPVRMYEYVRNAIDFEPYYGSRKGATETNLEGSGNDIDTASLLIALYRAAGIPARYVSGVVDVPIEKAINWVGVETPEAAAKLFSAGGTPAKLLISGGKPKTLQIEHTWAEVYVAYEDYRGAGEGSGEKIWVPLDGSMKGYERVAAARFVDRVSESDGDVLADAFRSAITTTPYGIASLDATAFTAIEAQATSRTASALETAFPFEESVALFGSQRITEEHLGLLPATLPVHCLSASGEWVAVPAAATTRIRVALMDADGASLLDYTAALASVGERRLVVAYSSASEIDAELAATYSSLADVPAHLVRVRPVLLLDEQVLATGRPTGLGSSNNLAVDVQRGSGALAAGETKVVAGSVFCVNLDLGRAATGPLVEAGDAFTGEMQAIATALDSQAATVSVTPSRLMGGFLHAAGMWYWAGLDAMNGVAARGMGLSWRRDISLAFTGCTLQSRCLLGLPVATDVSSLVFDVDADQGTVVTQHPGDAEAAFGFNLVSGSQSSFMEGMAFPVLMGETTPTVCTVTVMLAALEQGIPVTQVDSRTIDAVRGRLRLPAAVGADIEDSVERGLVVMTPERPVTLGSWTGVGYVVADPDTGGAGYMITDGSGGSDMMLGAGVAISVITGTARMILNGAILQALNGGQWIGRMALSAAQLFSLAVGAAGIGITIISCAGALGKIEGARLSDARKDWYREQLISTATAMVMSQILVMVLSRAYPAFMMLGPMIGMFTGLAYSLAASYWVDCAEIEAQERGSR